MLLDFCSEHELTIGNTLMFQQKYSLKTENTEIQFLYFPYTISTFKNNLPFQVAGISLTSNLYLFS